MVSMAQRLELIGHVLAGTAATGVEPPVLAGRAVKIVDAVIALLDVEVAEAQDDHPPELLVELVVPILQIGASHVVAPSGQNYPVLAGRIRAKPEDVSGLRAAGFHPPPS